METLLTSKPNIPNKPRIPLVLKFNRILLNTKKIINKHWHIFRINPKLKMDFKKAQ